MLGIELRTCMPDIDALEGREKEKRGSLSSLCAQHTRTHLSKPLLLLGLSQFN